MLAALSPRGYFSWAVLGYASGLGLTFCALAFSWFGDQGQPALLYLVPCTLGSVLCVALARRELRPLLLRAKAPASGTAGGDDHSSGPEDEESGGGGSGVGADGRRGGAESRALLAGGTAGPRA